MNLPVCPVCGIDELWARDELLGNGYYHHYYVECTACGVEFHHKDFYSFNGIEKFFEDAGRGECEDEGGDDEFMCSNCGYAHGYTPEELKDPNAFSFCPTCGYGVRR